MCPFQPVPQEEPQGASGTAGTTVTTLAETPEHAVPQPEDDELYTQVFAGRGAYWEERYQSALKQCRRKKGNNETVEVRMEFEPDNPEDRNAIRFDALLDGIWHPLGYVGCQKIPKLTSAIRNNEIRSVELSNVRSSFVYRADRLMMTGYFTITKLNRWLPDASENTYNALLNI